MNKENLREKIAIKSGWQSVPNKKENQVVPG